VAKTRNSPRANRVVGVGESLEELSRRLGTAPPQTLSVVFARWGEAAGESVAGHVQPERIEGNSLIVSAESPAWASHLRTLAPGILARLRELAGDDVPDRIAIRVTPRKRPSDQDL
jgi:predicted nucleic acid-binding Zn ribbon protein